MRQKREMEEEMEERRRNEEHKRTYRPKPVVEESPEVPLYGKNNLKPSSFEIMRPLGAGAFGQVWLVKNKNNEEIMAMKVIDKERLIKDDLMPYAISEKNIMREIKHPFIIALRHSVQTPEKYFLIMEYCCGGDLASIVSKLGFVGEELARNYIAEIILAIETLHEHNIAYR